MRIKRGDRSGHGIDVGGDGGFKVAFTLRVKYGLAHRLARTLPAECSAPEYDKLQRTAAKWVHGPRSECLIYLRFSEEAQVICRSAILHAEREGYFDDPLRGSS